MSNSVPEGWDFRELGDFIQESIAGEWGNEAQGDKNDIPVLRSTNFTNSGIIDYSKIVFRNIEEKKRIKKALKYGDILLEKSGGSPSQPVGRVVYFDKVIPHLFSNFTQKLTPINECDKKYLFYKLYFEYQNGTVLKFQQQTTGIINFQLAEFLGFRTIFAPLPEQQKIATILSSVDDVIEKTRAQIDKLKDLKTGMMQELLTKGIWQTEFKDSPVGSIPLKWEVAELKEYLSFISYGFTNPMPESDFGPLMVTAKDINFLKIHYDTARMTTLKAFEGDLSDKSRPRLNDILLTKDGTLGRVALVERENICINQSVAVLRPNDKVLPKFLLYLLASPLYQREMLDNSGGSTIKHIYITVLDKMKVAIPEKNEQIKIVDILDSLFTKLSLCEKRLNCSIKIKKALMRDLLTGKVRVNVENHQEERMAV
jgi:type I restriction enzyme, S subunit